VFGSARRGFRVGLPRTDEAAVGPKEATLRRLWVFIAILVTLCAASGQKVDFTGHKVIRAYLTKPSQLDRIEQAHIDIWTENAGVGPLDLRVSPKQLRLVEQWRIPYFVLIEDVQRVIDEQAAEVRGQGMFDDYMDLDALNAQLAQWEADYPQICKRFQFGTAVEGRPMYGLKITSGLQISENYGMRKPGVFFHGLIHAREWIAGATVMYIANYLLQGYGVDRLATNVVNHMEIYCAPCVNPDGYSYSWTNNRMWRKNRRYNGGGSYGVDLNRNFGYGWGGLGSSGSPSSETYRGPSPFSEPETQAIRDLILDNPSINGYLDYHSYSQLVMYPWGYTSTLPPDNAIYYAETGRMSDIIYHVHGKYYDYGPIYTTIYPASGVSVDWGYGEGGTMAITIELRDTGQYGFLLPPSQIIPNCEENLPAALDYAMWVYELSRPAEVRKR
jgi:murein tripeptide amidase MpaA